MKIVTIIGCNHQEEVKEIGKSTDKWYNRGITFTIPGGMMGGGICGNKYFFEDNDHINFRFEIYPRKIKAVFVMDKEESDIPLKEFEKCIIFMLKRLKRDLFKIRKVLIHFKKVKIHFTECDQLEEMYPDIVINGKVFSIIPNVEDIKH